MDRQRHIRYFAHSLRSLPKAYTSLDTNRLTLVHFCVQSLDLLGVLDDVSLLKELAIDKGAIIEWIYSLQTLPTLQDSSFSFAHHAGFKGGTFLGGTAPIYHQSTNDSNNTNNGDDSYNYQGWEYDHGHIAMTYTALESLITLGDSNLSRVNKPAIVAALRTLQQDDGSYRCIHVGSEHDMRFLYCACSISHMLGDFSGVNVEAAIQYVRDCRTYDGAISLIPGQEGHGGSTFCGVAVLHLTQSLDRVLEENDWRRELIHWCVSRQADLADGGGLQGRPNKAQDTCYSYWIGGTLQLLESHQLLDHGALYAFVLDCQTDMGGFGKSAGAYPDLLHSFYSLAWLSLSTNTDFFTATVSTPDKPASPLLQELDCALGLGKCRARQFEI